MLSAEKLTKKYGHLTVLNGVSLELPKGQFVSIVGPSGAGKSTLLHLLGGLDKPDEGIVLMDGVNVFSLSSKKQAQWRNKNLGFVFQFHHLLPEFSAQENVAMPLWIAGMNKAKAMQQAFHYLSQVGLKGKELQKPGELSGGEQQRVAIARALVTQPTLLLADEPTGNLDSNNAKLVHQLFIDTQKQYGHTIVMVTHNEELAQQTDRSLHMMDGVIVKDELNH